MNIDEILSEDDHADIIMTIFDELSLQTADGDLIDRLEPAARVFFYVQNFDTYMNNEGFSEFFSVTAPSHIEHTLKALEAVGAQKMKAILERAITVWSAPIPEYRSEREDILLTNLDTWNNIFKKLNDEYLKYPDELDVLLVVYVEKNKSDFK
jgi:hypothetical protein